MKIFLYKYIHFALLILFSLSVLAMSIKVTMFRYNNFEYGKFDLGNMSQMVFNTSKGHFMEVTDYFGTNMPRWGMSHVDPFLVVFVPFYWVYADPRVLIIGQLVLLISSALFIYLIGIRIVGSRTISLLVSLSFLLYPAVGYLLAWTGFHGVTAVVPFFLVAFWVFEEMHHRNKFGKKGVTLFYLLCAVTMSGKEEISLIMIFYGMFIIFFRKKPRVGIPLCIASLVWFVFSFFILIPSASHYRIDGFYKFEKSVGIDIDPSRDVLKSNYFLSRYGEFGTSYLEIVKNMILNPIKVGQVFFSGDGKENFMMTFVPMLFLPFFYLPALLISLPEFLINYLTTQSGVGTSEIFNHRISMIIPILFISTLYSIRLFESAFHLFFKRNPRFLGIAVSILLLGANIYTSSQYQNPIMLWFTQSVGKRLSLSSTSFAADSKKAVQDPVLGEKIKVKKLETKDRACFDGAIALVPKEASVSAPDYLGAHLSLRRYNSLFPGNFDNADIVILDVFSKKVSSILGVDISLINKVAGKVLRDRNVKLIYSCSNVFVFQRTPEISRGELLPLQDSFAYPEKFTYLLGQGLYVVDSKVPAAVERAKPFEVEYVYNKKESLSLNAFVLYTSFINSETGDAYQVVNLPSFGVLSPREWVGDAYYIEKNTFVLPDKLLPGTYRVALGLTNNVKYYNIYLSDLVVK